MLIRRLLLESWRTRAHGRGRLMSRRGGTCLNETRTKSRDTFLRMTPTPTQPRKTQRLQNTVREENLCQVVCTPHDANINTATSGATTSWPSLQETSASRDDPNPPEMLAVLHLESQPSRIRASTRSSVIGLVIATETSKGPSALNWTENSLRSVRTESSEQPETHMWRADSR